MRRALALSLLVLLLILAPSGPARGWLNPTFEEDVEITQDPTDPTSADSVQVRIRTRDPSLAIKFAYLLYFIRQPGSDLEEGPYNATFIPVSESANRRLFAPAIRPQLNGTVVTYRIDAWDFFNEPRGSDWYSYTVIGAVVTRRWTADTFEENLVMAWTPTGPDPHQPVTVTIQAIDPQVTISTAHLYLVAAYLDEAPVQGGFIFQRQGNVSLEVQIPGYPAGTLVRWWVIAYDLSNEGMTSEVRSYSVSVDRYTSNAIDAYPQPELVAGMALATAAAVPFVLWYGLQLQAQRRRRR